MEPFEKYEHAGVTVELHYDDSGINPRKDFDHAGKIVSFTREFDGDEYLSVDEDLNLDCPRCEGSGENQERYQLERKELYGWVTIGAGTFEALEPEMLKIIGKSGYDAFAPSGGVRLEPAPCPRCDGEGTVTMTVAKYLGTFEDAEVVVPLRFSDYGSSGSQIGETDNDNANAAIYCTAEKLREEWDGDREKAKACLLAEVEEMDAWLKGEVYGYVIKGPNGEELEGKFYDSCWGFIGDLDYVRKEANQAAENVSEMLDKEKREAFEMAARDIETVEV